MNLAILGATGAVGQEFLRILEQRAFPYDSLKLLASSRSAGGSVVVGGQTLMIEEATEQSFEGVDIVLASAGGSVSKRFAPAIRAAGATMIDNTSAFRMDADVPLVAPEVNPDAARDHRQIIANPNCSTIQMVVALAPLHRKVGIERLVISTYQSTSGKGAAAMEELREQARQILAGEEPKVGVEFPKPIAFNCLPHIDVFLPNGYTKEETKMMNETRKILDDASIRITATTVRVPVFRSHAESVNVELRGPLTAVEARELLSNAPGVKVMDDPFANEYPTPLEAEGRDETFVGRIRDDVSNPNTLDMWIVSDNLRKGAALNAIQIAELLIQKRWARPPAEAGSA